MFTAKGTLHKKTKKHCDLKNIFLITIKNVTKDFIRLKLCL